MALETVLILDEGRTPVLVLVIDNRELGRDDTVLLETVDTVEPVVRDEAVVRDWPVAVVAVVLTLPLEFGLGAKLLDTADPPLIFLAPEFVWTLRIEDADDRGRFAGPVVPLEVTLARDALATMVFFPPGEFIDAFDNVVLRETVELDLPSTSLPFPPFDCPPRAVVPAVESDLASSSLSSSSLFPSSALSESSPSTGLSITGSSSSY